MIREFHAGAIAALLIATAAPTHSDAVPAAEGSGYAGVLKRVDDSLRAHQPLAAISALTEFARRWPGRVKAVNCLAIAILDATAGEGDALDAARFDLADALDAAEWSCDDRGMTSDHLWLGFMSKLARKGDLARAGKVAGRLIEPDALIEVRSVTVYDPIVAASPDRFDVSARLDSRLRDLEAEVAAHPRILGWRNALFVAMLEKGQYAEVVQRAGAVIASFGPTIYDSGSFDDPDQLNWTLDSMSRAELMSGDADPAVSTLQFGASLAEGSVPNVSQTLNLAQLLVSVGRDREALELANSVDPATLSPYGALDREGVRACAYAGLGDNVLMEASVAYVEQHARESPSLVETVLLCTGKTDRAAESVVHAIEDPNTRDSTLADLQHYVIPSHLPPRALAITQAHDALSERPEVKRAIETYGHLQAYPLVRTSF